MSVILSSFVGNTFVIFKQFTVILVPSLVNWIKGTSWDHTMQYFFQWRLRQPFSERSSLVSCVFALGCLKLVKFTSTVTAAISCFSSASKETNGCLKQRQDEPPNEIRRRRKQTHVYALMLSQTVRISFRFLTLRMTKPSLLANRKLHSRHTTPHKDEPHTAQPLQTLTLLTWCLPGAAAGCFQWVGPGVCCSSAGRPTWPLSEWCSSHLKQKIALIHICSEPSATIQRCLKAKKCQNVNSAPCVCSCFHLTDHSERQQQDPLTSLSSASSEI